MICISFSFSLLFLLTCDCRIPDSGPPSPYRWVDFFNIIIPLRQHLLSTHPHIGNASHTPFLLTWAILNLYMFHIHIFSLFGLAPLEFVTQYNIDSDSDSTLLCI